MVTLGELLDRADQDDAAAVFELGLAHSEGVMVEKNLGLAVEYFRRAYELGVEDAIYRLALAYERGGDGLEPDLKEAFYWWRQGANWGRLELAKTAYHRVGRAYAEGTVVVKDKSQAILWLEKAVNAGQDEAKALLDELKSEKE
jgi:hypothetical protein